MYYATVRVFVVETVDAKGIHYVKAFDKNSEALLHVERMRRCSDVVSVNAWEM